MEKVKCQVRYDRVKKSEHICFNQICSDFLLLFIVCVTIIYRSIFQEDPGMLFRDELHLLPFHELCHG